MKGLEGPRSTLARTRNPRAPEIAYREPRGAQPVALLRLLHRVAAASTRAASAGEALDAVIALVCRSRNWTVGHLYWRRFRRSDDGQPQLAPTDHWYVKPGRNLGQFVRETRERRFAPGEGLIGAVAETGRAEWTDALDRDERYVRQTAVRAGLRTAVILPVFVGRRVAAVLEFYAAARVPRDEQVLAALVTLATHVGLVITRHELESELSQLADEEEHRIGAELHDRVGQALTAAGLLARGLHRRLQSRAAAEADDAAAVVEAVEQTKEHVRSLARSLVPAEIESGGLRSALEHMVRRCASTTGMECRLSGAADVTVADQFVATQLLRIVQEALNNSVSHGRGTRLLVELEADSGSLAVSVHDDGVGFPDAEGARGGIGLRIMRHRATLIGGVLEIGSGKLGGTTVTCRLPRR